MKVKTNYATDEQSPRRVFRTRGPPLSVRPSFRVGGPKYARPKYSPVVIDGVGFSRAAFCVSDVVVETTNPNRGRVYARRSVREFLRNRADFLRGAREIRRVVR